MHFKLYLAIVALPRDRIAMASGEEETEEAIDKDDDEGGKIKDTADLSITISDDSRGGFRNIRAWPAVTHPRVATGGFPRSSEAGGSEPRVATDACHWIA